MESIGRREFCLQITALGREDHCSPPLPTQGSTGGAHWSLGNSTAWDSSSCGLPHPILCSPPRQCLGHPGLNPLTWPLSHLPAFARATNPEHRLCPLGKGSCVSEGPAGASPLPQLSLLPRWHPPLPPPPRQSTGYSVEVVVSTTASCLPPCLRLGSLEAEPKMESGCNSQEVREGGRSGDRQR